MMNVFCRFSWSSWLAADTEVYLAASPYYHTLDEHLCGAFVLRFTSRVNTCLLTGIGDWFTNSTFLSAAGLMDLKSSHSQVHVFLHVNKRALQTMDKSIFFDFSKPYRTWFSTLFEPFGGCFIFMKQIRWMFDCADGVWRIVLLSVVLGERYGLLLFHGFSVLVLIFLTCLRSRKLIFKCF